MSMDDLARFSDGLQALTDDARALVVGVRAGSGRAGSGVLWRDGAVVTSEQALPDSDEYLVSLPGGDEATARLAGRDRGTNVAVLRLTASATTREGAEPAGTGALAMVFGTDGSGGCTARLSLVHRMGPAWHSMAGGRIDRLIALDVRLSGTEEGGPVLDARGRLLGMSTLGPRRRTLVIPHATIERVLEPLLAAGRVPRGWLGLSLQPVTLPDALRNTAGCEAGLMVMALSPSGPAEAAGVLPGDILLSLDGAPVSTPRALSEHLASERVGTGCSMRLLRAGAVQEIAATIGPRP